MKKKLWLAAVAGLALSTSAAFAADLGQPYYKAPPAPPVAAPGWTGFYVGINGGWGWNREGGDFVCEELSCLDRGAIVKPKGGLAGGQIGYNQQSGIVVYGIEADLQWAHFHDSASVETSFSPDFSTTFENSAKLSWFGTVRGRLGIAPWGNALLYVTGGLIYGGENVSSSQTVRFSSFVLPFLIGPSIQTSTESNSTTRTGGTVGVGLEYLFTPNLSGKIEGLWYDMGHEDLPISNVEALHFNFQGAILRAGLNYHFNWGGGPPVETRD